MTNQPGSSAEDVETGTGHEPSPAASALPSHGAQPSESQHAPAPVVLLLSPFSAPISARTPEAASLLDLVQPQTASLVAHDVPSSNHAPAQSSVAQSTAAVSPDPAAASTPGAATLDDLAQSRKRKRSLSPPSASTLPAPASTSSSSAPPATVALSTPPSQPADQGVTNGTGASTAHFAPSSATPTSISFGFGGSSIAPLVHASASSIPADAAAERQRLSASVPRSDLAADPATAPQCLISTDSIFIASAPPAKRMNRSRTPPAAAITSATTDSTPAPAPAPAASSAFLPPPPSPSSFNTTSPTLVPIPIAATTPISTHSLPHSFAATRTSTDDTTSAPSGSVPMSPAASAAALSDTPAAPTVDVAVTIADDRVRELDKRPPPAHHADDAQQGRPLNGAAPISDPSASSSAPAAGAPAPAAPADSSVLDRSSAASAAAARPDSCDASNFQIPRARSPSSAAAAAETHSAGASSNPSDDALQNSDLAPLHQNSISVNIPPSSPRLAGGGASDGVDLAKSDLRSNASTSDPLTDAIAPATNHTTLPSPLSRAAAASQAVDHLESDAESHTGLTASTKACSSSDTLSRPSATDQNGGAGQAASPSLTAALFVQDAAPPSQPASEALSEMQSDAPSQICVGAESADEPTPGKGSISLPLSTAVASQQSTPSAQTPQPTSTISTLQLASEALSSIPQHGSPSDANVNTAAAELLTVLHQRSKKASAIRSPHPGSVRSRSAATTPVPPSLLLGLKHPSLDVTAQSSRATTPTRTPSGRSKRRRRERNAAATPTAAVLALPSIDASDRRRSARVAKAVTATASDNSSAPNLALFGFSPYLENLVMNAKETDRRTRSGGRAVRPSADRAPARGKRSAAKNKTKEVDPDGPDDEAKSELYRQLCILSYQLQADLDMVPVQSLEQLRARFASPPPADKVDDSHNTAPLPAHNTAHSLETSATRSDVLKPAAPGYNQPQMSGAVESIAYDTIVKTEPPESPQLAHAAASHARPPFSPESSPEVALMDTARATNGTAPSSISASYTQGPYPSYASHQPYSWDHKAESVEDEPMSPVPRPARSNIMSISALMSGPSPKARSPTPPRIPATPPVPSYMQAWTDEDEMASQILQACAAAIPKLDTTELDRLTKIAELAAFDLPAPCIEETGQADSDEAERADRERHERFSKFAPGRLDPLDTLDTKELYAREEAEYLEEMQASGELYESIRYLSNFDDVVDEWRAGELSRLRLQLEMRKAEIERIWTCDRKLAWSSYIDARAGPLYREAAFEARHARWQAAFEARHARWQAEMELDLLAVHRRKTRGYAKLTHNIWTPPIAGIEDPDSVALYKKFGRFLSGSRYAEVEDPLVRADLRKMQEAWREHKRRSRKSERAQEEEADDAERPTSEAALPGDGEADEQAMSIASSEASDWDEDYDSDSYMSSDSGISSLPSFSSVCSSPRMRSVTDIDVVVSDADGLVSEAVSLLGADSDSDGDADESLWARQLRLANQIAASKEATDVSAAASGLQTPAEVGDGARSMVSSRAPSPAPSSKLDQDQIRDRKRKRKKPPPPGARLWKKGRVQRDPPYGEIDEVELSSMQASKSQQADGRYGVSDRMQSSSKEASALGFDTAQARDFEPGSFHDMRIDDSRSNMLATPSYAGYGARAGYGAAREFDYDRERALHDPYAHPSYPVYQHGYPAFQEPPMPRYSEDAPMADARYANPRVTPPLEMQHDARYAYPYPPPPRAAAYPPANPPPPHPPSQWRY